MTAEVEKIFKEASNPDFWGEASFSFKAGKIIKINFTKSIPVQNRNRDYPDEKQQRY